MRRRNARTGWLAAHPSIGNPTYRFFESSGRSGANRIKWGRWRPSSSEIETQTSGEHAFEEW
jgi:hypothetical protein